MEEALQTKVTPESVMDYNFMLMKRIDSVFLNIDLDGDGLEQTRNLVACLKPKYKEDTKEYFDELNKEFNAKIKALDARINNSQLKSDRANAFRRLKDLKRNYSRCAVEKIIETMDKAGALEFTRALLMGGQGSHDFIMNSTRNRK